MAWWTVYGTLADLACLALLVRRTRREGLRLSGLLRSSASQPLPKIVGTGLLYFAMTMPLFLGGFVLSSLITYGSLRPHVDAALLGARQLPTWAAIYSVTVCWIIWSATEELTYQAYLLQRFQALSGRLTPGLLIVGFWWAVQQSALPFLPDLKYAIWRFLGFVPGLAMLMVLYVRKRQLTPVIVAHWLMDCVASASTIAWK